MSFLMKLQEEGQRARSSLKKTSTIVTDVSGRRYNASTGAYEESNKTGFVEDTSPDPGLYQCIPGLYIGSQDAALNWGGTEVPKKKNRISNDDDQDNETEFFPGMQQLGITHVVNLFSQNRPFMQQGVHYLNETLMDLPEQTLATSLQTHLQFIHDAISANGKVLVHCNAGVSRSAAIIIAYLIQYHGMTYGEALSKIRENRPSAKPNSGFEKQLMEFEVTCKNR